MRPYCPACAARRRECEGCEQERRMQEQRAQLAALGRYLSELAAGGADVQVATGHRCHGTGRNGDHIGTPTGWRKLEGHS